MGLFQGPHHSKPPFPPCFSGLRPADERAARLLCSGLIFRVSICRNGFEQDIQNATGFLGNCQGELVWGWGWRGGPRHSCRGGRRRFCILQQRSPPPPPQLARKPQPWPASAPFPPQPPPPAEGCWKRCLRGKGREDAMCSGGGGSGGCREGGEAVPASSRWRGLV